MEAYGAPPEEIDAMRGRIDDEDSEDYEVWFDNWKSFVVFTRLESQWTWNDGGKKRLRMGLPSERVESSVRMMGIPRAEWPGLFDDLQAMEFAIIARQNEG